MSETQSELSQEDHDKMLNMMKAYHEKGGRITKLQPALKEFVDAKSTTKTFKETWKNKSGKEYTFLKIYKVDAISGNKLSQIPENNGKCTYTKLVAQYIVTHIKSFIEFAGFNYAAYIKALYDELPE